MRGLSTTALRSAWGDGVHCYSGPLTRVTLHGGAVISVRPAVVPVVNAVNAIFVKHNYRCTPPDCGAMNCRAITGGSKISLHGLAIAADINWNDNPYQPNDGSIKHDIPWAVIRDIEKLTSKTGKPLVRCGINYTGANVDPMHFEVCCTPADVASGIKGTSGAPLLTLPVSLGSKGPWVRWAQTFCNELAHKRRTPQGRPGARITVDGEFGKRTRVAVAELQRGILTDQKALRRPKREWVRTDGVFDQRTFDLCVLYMAPKQKAA